MKQLLFLYLHLVPLALFAQTRLGIRDGLSLASLHDLTKAVRGSGSREGIYSGIHTSFRLGRGFYLQPEINYTTQGGQITGVQEVAADFAGIDLPKDRDTYTMVQKNQRLNYIEVPLLVRFEIERDSRYSVYIGPAVGFLLSAKTEIQSNSTLYLDPSCHEPVIADGRPAPPVSIHSNINTYNGTRKINPGMLAGVGFGYPLKSRCLLIDVRAHLGFRNLAKFRFTNESRYTTSSFYMTIGYEIDVK